MSWYRYQQFCWHLYNLCSSIFNWCTTSIKTCHISIDYFILRVYFNIFKYQFCSSNNNNTSLIFSQNSMNSILSILSPESCAMDLNGRGCMLLREEISRYLYPDHIWITCWRGTMSGGEIVISKIWPVRQIFTVVLGLVRRFFLNV